MAIHRQIFLPSFQANDGFALEIQLAWAAALSQYDDSTGVTICTAKVNPHGAFTQLTLSSPVSSALEVELRKVHVEVDPGETASAHIHNIRGQDGLRDRISYNLNSAASSQTKMLDGMVSRRLLAVTGDLSDIEVLSNFVQSNAENLPLSMICYVEGPTINVQVIFGNDSVEEWLTERILSQFNSILRHIVSDRSILLGDAMKLNEEDRLQLRKWNAKLPTRVCSTIHNFIKERCTKQPDAPAVHAWDGNLSYQQLDELSSRLALALTAQGIGAKMFVPICLKKSLWVTVALLGVIKSGAAFVLFDPSHPIKRLQGICRDVGAKFLISSIHEEETHALLGPAVISVGHDDTAIWPAYGSGVHPHVSPNDPVYAAFTSGSTGKPKGVVIEHGSFCTGTFSHGKALGLEQNTRVFQFSSYGFDASILENLMTLVHGGCICVPSEDDRQNHFTEALERLQGNWLCLTPSMVKLFRPEDLPTLKTMVLAGESATATDIETWFDRVKVVISYGPAECSVGSTARNSPKKFLDPKEVGLPTGCVCWIVDQYNHEKLMPLGAVGELIVEGPIVGRGYIGQPELTSAVFLTKLPPWLPGFTRATRLYKTGDLVRYDWDGSLRYVGRKDTQVKIYGQRIELGEIEHEIKENLEDAKIVVVDLVTPHWRPEHPSLTAFVWSESETSADGTGSINKSKDLFSPPNEQFRAQCQATRVKLRESLPPHMVPAVFIPLAQLPLSVTGKTDRRRLRESAALTPKETLSAYIGLDSEKRTPLTNEEVELRSLVAQVLNLHADDIGMDDCFLELGGDSLSAMKLAARYRKLGKELAVSDTLKRPKLSKILSSVQDKTSARIITTVLGDRPLSLLSVDDSHVLVNEIASHIPFVSANNIRDMLPTSELQKAAWNFRAEYFAVYLHGPLDMGRLKGACDTLVQRHSILRTVFTEIGGTLVQIVLDHAKIPFLIYEYASRLVDFVKWFWEYDRKLCIPRNILPLMFTLVRKNRDEHALIIRLSHAIHDGTSIGILLRDLSALYQGNQLLEAPGFSSCVYQWSRLRTTEALQFWRNLLQGSSMTYIAQKTDYDNNNAGIKEEIMLEVRKFVSITAPTGITLATIAKAAWALALSEHVGKSDVVFCQGVNGRAIPLQGIETVVGPCHNFIPVRVQLRTSWTGLDLLQYVQKQHFQMMAFETVELQDIIDNCTEWPKDTCIGTYVVDQTIGVDWCFSMGKIECITEHASASASSVGRGFLIHPIPRGDRQEITLSVPNTMVTQDTADRLIGGMRRYMIALAQGPEKQIDELRADSKLEPSEMECLHLGAGFTATPVLSRRN